ncbi:ABC transporter permease subunit [Actinomyces minihominis]|uniref:ABC transporter permease subunit n=1 Tax=Actinomyces minihominis TaxID=2002838 RepID=UPI001F5D67E8|nr:ABC transporter permease subunit [Actinomyces minihominis]
MATLMELDEVRSAKKSRFRLPPKDPDVNRWGPGFVVKLVLMALVNAFGVYVLFMSFTKDSWGIFAVMLALLIFTDWIYFSGRTLPLKYIIPGLTFLLIFQIYTVGYTMYVSFTNYGDGHNSTKANAVTALLMQNENRVPDSPTYPLKVIKHGGELGFAIVDDGTVMIGSSETPLHAEPNAVVSDGKITEVPGWEILTMNQIVQQQQEVVDLRVPVSEDPNAGSIRTTDGSTGFQARSVLNWDPQADTMTNIDTGVVYRDNGQGQFESDDGQTLPVGWRVGVGFDNYTKAFGGDSKYSGPFYQVLLWTFAQALLSVALTFLLGLFLAITFDKKVKGQKIYRTLMILPYAIPGFISALIFAGMFNKSYGFINQVILGGAQVPWLQDPWLAKFAILFVNLWLGFPYMFLIATGALQSVPEDVTEAAKIDGASAWRQWVSIKMPLVLIATAPLLISSFAFNFNNFTLIYMLTGGGPSFGDPSVPLGHTDILITMVYKMSGIDGGATKDFGLASALSILIFIIVGTISAIAFRQTRKLEEMM